MTNNINIDTQNDDLESIISSASQITNAFSVFNDGPEFDSKIHR